MTLPSAADVAYRIHRSDYEHALGLAVLHRPGSRGWAVAVRVQDTGEVLAWDGWYSGDDEVPPEAAKPVETYDWENWDDMPSKRLLEANGYWLGVLAELIQPEYSLDRYAASVLDHWDDPGQSGPGAVVAYYPLDLERVIAEVEREHAPEQASPYAASNRHEVLLTKLRDLGA